MSRKSESTAVKLREVPDGSSIPESVVDELMKNYKGPDDLKGPNGLVRQLTAALVSRAMDAELTEHLGYDVGVDPPEGQSNRRNGTSSKRVRTGSGEVDIVVPRDRDGSFEPIIVPKHHRQFDGFDDKIIAMYARGMSVRDIRSQLAEIYGVEVSPDLISRVTDSVLDELRAWQQRPLESMYCIVYLDALVVKMRDKGGVRNRSVYVAVGIPASGQREVLGLWVQDSEGAKFWCTVMEDLRRRGTDDILILCADGLAGMDQAVEAVFPQTIFQTCVVHVIRSSMRFVSWGERKAVCADLKPVYTAANAEAAEHALEEFEATWNDRYPSVAKSWRNRWDAITPFLSYPKELRRAVYTTNAIEALNRNLRKVLKTKGHLPSEQAALKLLYLAIEHGNEKWSRGLREWPQVLGQFAIYFDGRVPN